MARNRRRRRRNGGIINFVANIFDDIYDFIDEDILDRGRDTERDLRRAGRNWTDSSYDSYDSYDDDRRRGRRRRRDRDEVRELAEAIDTLAHRIRALELTAATN